MNKTVKVCDADKCRTLADHVCPLCEGDFCAAHFTGQLAARLSVRKPKSGSWEPGQAAQYDHHNSSEVAILICSPCWQGLYTGARPMGAMASLTESLKPQMIESCRAALAAQKLARSGS